jgi:hypothetical protein
MTAHVRPATRADADAIACVHVQASHETYTEMIPGDAFASLAEREGQCKTRLQAGRHVVIVAEVGRRVVRLRRGGAHGVRTRQLRVAYDAHLGQLYIVREFTAPESAAHFCPQWRTS